MQRKGGKTHIYHYLKLLKRFWCIPQDQIVTGGGGGGGQIRETLGQQVSVHLPKPQIDIVCLFDCNGNTLSLLDANIVLHN